MQIHNQILSNPKKAAGILLLMSTEGLKSLAVDIKAQVGAGLLSDTEASEKLNIISGIILDRECTKVFSEGCTDILCN